MTAKAFPVTATVSVRFRDLDPLGHVNNAVYLSYLEWARVLLTIELAKVQGREIPNQIDPTAFEFILAEMTIAYRSPAYLGETLAVGIVLASARRTSFVFEYQVTERETGRLVATARSVQVMFDYAAGVKKPIPDEFLAAVADLQGAPVARS